MSDTISKEKEVLKVHIIDDINTTDFEQLKVLMKKFQIDAYIRNHSTFFDLDRSEQNRIINNVIEKFDNLNLENEDLKPGDIKRIAEIIESKIKQMEEEITEPNVRIYALKDGDKVVAFQYVYIQEEKREDEGKIEGHISMSYTEPEYRRKGSVMTMSGERKQGSFSKILIEDVKEWFSENGVTHEQIGAGENVFYNMETYIAKWGFIPDERINGTIFMEKDLNNPIEDKSVLRAIFNMCVKNRKRTKAKTPQDIESEIEESEELKTLSSEVKKRLVQVFLKDNERETTAHEQFDESSLNSDLLELSSETAISEFNKMSRNIKKQRTNQQGLGDKQYEGWDAHDN